MSKANIVQVFHCLFFQRSFTLFLLLYVYQLAAQINMVPDYTGTTQYLAPEGWTIQVNKDEQNGIFSWTAQEKPGKIGSPGLLIIAMDDFPGSNTDLVTQLLNQQFSTLKVDQRKDISQNESHFILKGKTQKIRAKVAAVFLKDPQQERIFLSYFAAPLDRYEELGRENLLYEAINKSNPFLTIVTNTDTKQDVGELEGELNMQDIQVQNQLLLATSSISPSEIKGKWLQVMSFVNGETFQEVHSENIIYGSRGYGHILELNSDNTYRLSYKYDQDYQACTNSAEVIEKGKYKLNDNILTLFDRAYNGVFTVCGKKSWENKDQQPDMSYRIGLSSSGTYLVLQGLPMPYTISTETSSDGKEIFQEGFSRIE